MRRAVSVLIVVMFLLSICTVSSIADAPDARRFSLSYFDIDIDYPSSVKPGDTVTITVSATAKSSTYVQDLTVEILVPSPRGDMRSIYSMSVVRDTSTYSGSRYSKAAAVTIPSDVLRSFMMTTVAQNVRTYYYSYSYYPYSYGGYWNSRSYNSYWWPMYYVTTSYLDSVENGIAPLSYILSTTPEYTQLKSEFDKLQTDYNRVSQENLALNARLNKLQNDYNALQAQNESLRSAVAFTGIALLVILVAVAVLLVLSLLTKQGRIVIKSPTLLKKDKS